MNIKSMLLAASIALSFGSIASAQSPPFNAYSIGTLGGNCVAAAAIPYQNSIGFTQCSNAGTPGQVMYLDVGGVPSWKTVAGTGTVTSVGLSLPPLFNVTGSPITAAGTLTGTLASQSANTVFSAPNGSAGTPAFRNLVGADFGSQSANTFLSAPAGGSGNPTFRTITLADISSALSTVAPPIVANTMLIDNAAGTARQTRTFSQVRDALDVAFTANYSMPNAITPVNYYVTTAGTCSDTSTDPTWGTTASTSFCTFDGAITFAKKYVKFTGRLNAVNFMFEGGINWGSIQIGSDLRKGEDYYPFTIGITSISNANRAIFNTVGVNSWNANYVFVTQVKVGYVVANRRNGMSINDVTFTNVGTAAGYAMRAAYGGKLHVFGLLDFESPVTYTSGMFYAQDNGYIAVENGDNDPPFPRVTFTNLSNVTIPNNIYRMIYGSNIYMPINPYTELKNSGIGGGNFYVDASSLSTQTITATDLNKNTASGGPVVGRTGTDTAGSERYADGKFKQWGIVTITNAAVGQSSPAQALLTYPTAFSASTRIKYNWSVPAGGDVSVNAPGPSNTGVQFTITNRGASTASFSIYWEASGSL